MEEIEQQAAEAVAQTAPRHGVEQITYISGATVIEENRWFPMINRKFMAEKAIRETAIPYTIFCPTWMMESLPLFVAQGRASVLGKQPCPYHWVAADDLARMVSTSYGLGEAANKQFFVLGPEAIRMHEALRRYCAVFRPEIKDVSSMPFWLVKMLATITRSQELKSAGEMISYFEKVGEGSGLAKVDPILDVPTITLVMWLEKRKARLSTARS